MNQASSNSSMQRSTAETLKQIQKQGLSVSIVSTADSSRSSFTADTSVSKESRSKQFVTIDKTPKLPPRSSISTDGKSILSQTRSASNLAAETLTSSSRQQEQLSFHEGKMPGSITKSNVPVSSSSETRAFGSQSWSNPPSVSNDNKIQAGSNRSAQIISVLPETKNQSSTGRHTQAQQFSENKVPNSRTNQSGTPTSENKISNRLGQGTDVTQIRSQNRALTFEGKLQTVQARMPVGSPPPDMKILSSRNFSVPVHENKSTSGQRSAQVLSDSKVFNVPTQSQVITVIRAAVDAKTPVRGTRAMKSMAIEQIRPIGFKTTSKVPSDQVTGTSLMSERCLNNPFRLATTSGKKVSNSLAEEKLVQVTKVSENVAFVAENQTMSHSKGSQNISVQSESKRVVKISSVSSDQSQKESFDFSDNLLTSGISTMSTTKGTTKRPQVARPQNSPPAAKRKCVKKAIISEQSIKTQSNAEPSSSEESTPPKQYINMKGLTSGLTITPVPVGPATISTPSTSGASKKVAESGVPAVAICSQCKQCSLDLSNCATCGADIPPGTPLYRVKGPETFVVTKNVTTSIEKKIVYQFNPDLVGQNRSFHIQQGKVLMESAPVLQVSPRTKGRPKAKRKYVEPVCYTLSSDDEEPVQVPFNPMGEVCPDVAHFLPMESEGSKSEHSSNEDVLQEENPDFDDDPQFPGVTDINPRFDMEEEEPDEEEEMEFGEVLEEEEEEECSEEEIEEDEEVPPEEEPEPDDQRCGLKPTDYPLRCRSIRIGSYKVHPLPPSQYVSVVLSPDSMAFQAPVLTDTNKTMTLVLKDQDIRSVLAHFGRCLPIMFVFTTATFGEAVRNALNMSDKDNRYFDPMSKDDKTQKLTFLIEQMTEEQKLFLRQRFPGDKKVKEIDQKTANEILVRSTPNQNIALVKLHNSEAIIVPVTGDNQLPHAMNASPQLSVTKVMLPQPVQPVIKLFTYPPSPQTGGIAVTNEDLACLNEGEFLNDAIIDFYLKYVFHEKLTSLQRDRTHVFSSFFYPRLTSNHKERPGEDGKLNTQVRRHNQVRTWTRHVDIFSKDFIIIPVNVNVHWFLAIVCYPGKVPETADLLEHKESRTMDNVTSSDEQENTSRVIVKDNNNTSRVIIKELGNNEGDSPNPDENSMNSSMNSPYEVEEPPDSDDNTTETPDSTTLPDGRQRITREKEMPCICIFDSLSGPSRWRVAAILREYLEMEWKMKKGTRKLFNKQTMQAFQLKCPQQTNYSDCGLYLLQYVESFYENPIPYFGPMMPDLTEWFSEAKISKKRQQLQDLILQLQKKQQPPSTRRTAQSEGISSPVILQADNR